MLRTRNVLVCLTAVTLGLAAAVPAEANRVELVPLGDSEACGFAILNYARSADETIVNVQARNLKPEAVYTILLGDCGSDELNEWESIDSFTAKKNGKGHLLVKCDGDVSGRCIVIAAGALPPGAFYELGSDGEALVVMADMEAVRKTDAVKKKASRMGLRTSNRYMKSLGRT